MIFTFYSYQGGVGRSMVLANVAEWLYQQGLRVIIVDWDLEAPGLEKFFFPSKGDINKIREKEKIAEMKQRKEIYSQPGIIDLLENYKNQFLVEDNIEDIINHLKPINDVLYPVCRPNNSALEDIRFSELGRNLWLLTAGLRTDLLDYAKKVQRFDWKEFYNEFQGNIYFEWMRKQLLDNADIVLIDSRAGITEMGGVCTRQLADVVVSLCAPNFDNLDDIITIVRSFTHPEVEKYRGRSLEIIIVPSRVDKCEVKLRNEFMNSFEQKVSRFVPKSFQKVRTDFLKLIIEYVPRYSYLLELAIRNPEVGREGFEPLEENYKELAIHMSLLAPRRSSLYKKLNLWIDSRFPLPQVFVSYEFNNGRDIADELCKKFEQPAPLTIWQDIDVVDVDELQQIAELIHKVEYVLLVLTPKALDSRKTRRKWWLAGQRGKNVILIKEKAFNLDFNELPKWMLFIIENGFLFNIEKSEDIKSSEELDNLVSKIKSRFVEPKFKESYERTTSIKFSSEPKPLIEFITPPFMTANLPETYVDRPGKLVEIIKVLEQRSATVILEGKEGFGKTTLAAALCHDEHIQGIFYDGILWVTLGEKPENLINKVKKLISVLSPKDHLLSKEESTSITIERAHNRLGELLSNQTILLVIDEVWDKTHLEPFLHIGEHCSRLITTRNKEIKEILSHATPIQVGPMETEEAEYLLSTGLNMEDKELKNTLHTLVKHLWRWPLSLASANELLKKRIQQTEQPVSLDQIGFLLKRFNELVIFPPDINIPLTAVSRLWKATAEVNERPEVEKYCEQLHRLSLLSQCTSEYIHLHPVAYEHLTEYKKRSKLSELHTMFLNTYVHKYGDLKRNWHKILKDKPYLRRYLAHHLYEADQKNDLRDLLLNYDWIALKLEVESHDIQAIIKDYELLLQGEGKAEKEEGKEFDEKDRALRAVQQALRLSKEALAEGPAQLASQLLGRLRGQDMPLAAIKNLLERAERGPGVTWLRPVAASLTPPGSALSCKFIKHEGGVHAVAVTPDRRCVVSGSFDKTLRLWDLNTGEFIRNFEGHAGTIFGVAVTPDGQRIVSGSSDGTLRVWDLNTGRLINTLLGHTGKVYAVKITLNARYVISSSADRTLKLWDLDTGNLVRTFESHKDRVYAVTITSNGKRIVSGSRDGILHVWDIDTPTPKLTINNKNRIYAVMITPNDHYIISGDGKGTVNQGTIKIWNINDGSLVREFKDPRLQSKAHSQNVFALAVTRDSQIISGSGDYTLKLWDWDKGEPIRTFEGHSFGVNTLVLTPDDRQAISGSGDRTLRLWNLNPDRTEESKVSTSWTRCVAVIPDKQCIVSGSDDHNLWIWDLGTGTLKCPPLTGHQDIVDRVISVKLGSKQCVLSCSRDNTLKLWDLDNDKCLHSFKGHTNWVYTAAVIPPPDPNYPWRAISGAYDCTLRLWNLETGECSSTLPGHEEPVLVVEVTPDGRYAISGSRDKTLRVWNLETGECEHVLEGHTDWVVTVAVTRYRDSWYAVSGSHDCTLRLWKLETGECLCTFEGHEDKINTVVITKDNCFAISGSGDPRSRLTPSGEIDHTLRRWDLWKSDGCNLRFMDASDGNPEDEIIRKFEMEFESKKREYAVLIVDRPGDSGKWTIAGFNDEEKFCKFVINDPNQELSKELKQKPRNERRIVELARSILGRPHKPVEIFKGHQEGINQIMITPDGNHVISASQDHSLRLWKINSGGKCVAKFFGDTEISCVDIVDDRLFVAGAGNGALHVLELKD